MKRIRLTFVEENVSCEAVLLDTKAPDTCAMLWDALSAPVENAAIHAMYTGRELSFAFPKNKLPDNAIELRPENQIVIPVPGDLVWNGYRKYEWQGNADEIFDLGIFYGRDSRIFLPVGWRPSNLFAQIVSNLDSFADVCARCQSEGKKLLRIERVIQ